MEKQEMLKQLLDSVTVENIQKYILGVKANGQPRALYDIMKDYSKPRKKKKHHKKNHESGKISTAALFETYLYPDEKKSKKKKHKKKHRDDWHI